MNPFCITEIIFADKNIAEKTLLSRSGKKIVLLLSDRAERRWDLKDFRDSLEKQSESCIWIKYIPTNPTQVDILQALKTIGKRNVDTLIAIGGGSAIDLAKAISAFSRPDKNCSYTMEEITACIRDKSYTNGSFINIFAVPTTAGTGSELTQWATIWDSKNQGKYSIDVPELKPKLAVIVPELTLTLPPVVTLSTGLDALSHAVEAYWSKYTTPLVQEIAYRAIEIILENLGETLHSPYDLSHREKMCKASVLAGLAFSQTRTTACHAISYPLTQLYGVPHGIAAALTLSAVSLFNKGHFPNDDNLFYLFERYGGLASWLWSTCSPYTTLSLEFFGIRRNNVDELAELSFGNGRMDNNPVQLNKDDVSRILQSLLN